VDGSGNAPLTGRDVVESGAEWADEPRVTTRLKYERDGSGYIETGYKHYFVVPAIGGSPRKITSGTFHHSGSPQWSADGKRIAYLSYEDKVRTYQLTKLNLMNADGSDKRELLAGLDRSVSGLVWNKDSNGVLFQYDDHGDTKIAFTTLASKMRDIASNLGGTTIGRPYGGGSFSGATSVGWKRFGTSHPLTVVMCRAG
jgi:dipeptidyl aminopeptidase/acylaminoacyl peptidase